ncbi:NAD-dependent epimerase/dehydratase family protein, partial [Tenacibaculum finnmarkense]|uniref:NAD-dependent epimerase/dehydratase family protein n=1 Tax=Tenacibaculum finnmarkense TaxID=2781243 RepID=UPI001DF88186
MRILVFGANGFLGKEVVNLLKSNDFEVFTISRSDKSCNFNLNISKFDDFQVLPNHFFDVIINCATVLPGGNYLDNDYLDAIYKTNILGSQNICKWIESQQTVIKIINCSTLAVAQKRW